MIESRAKAKKKRKLGKKGLARARNFNRRSGEISPPPLSKCAPGACLSGNKYAFALADQARRQGYGDWVLCELDRPEHGRLTADGMVGANTEAERPIAR